MALLKANISFKILVEDKTNNVNTVNTQKKEIRSIILSYF